MRRKTRIQLEGLLQSMLDMHQVIAQTVDLESRITYLSECQQAAISAGETLENSEQSAKELVLILEEYCEELFIAAESENITSGHRDMWDQLIERAQEGLSHLPETYHIVFMPYKAEMWDSLESIWKACSEDERCECCVVPLPYYEYQSSKKSWIPRYDGNRFPDEVPVTYYKDYSLETVCPDAAYIHNPYDYGNYVTRIDPFYHSRQLKKYVQTLIYVPYFITAGYFFQLDAPAYNYMDYMIIQSMNAKEYFLGSNYYSKMIPLGSPKLDKIIQVCRSGVEMPEDWKPVLAGKKVLMLNTSLNHFLSKGEHFLKKLRYVFDLIREQDQVALIWRPHPLLEATIRSMRPRLLPEFGELVLNFLNDKIGILDRTQSIEKTVALSDGYIGEEESSVINLFQAAEKPIFILNDDITEEFTEEEKRYVHLSDIALQNDRIWAATGEYNALLWIDKEKKVHIEDRVAGQPSWYDAYPFIAADKDNIYLSPSMASCPMAYQPAAQQWEALMQGKLDTDLFCRRIVIDNHRIFCIPGGHMPILEYDIQMKNWRMHTDCIAKLLEADEDTNQEVTYDCVVSGGSLWVTATYTNRVLQLCIDDGEFFLHQIGEEGKGYSGITADEESLWLAEVHSGDVIRWNRSTGTTREIHMPEAFHTRKTRAGRELAHISLIDLGKWVVTVPGLSNGMVRIEKSTEAVSMLAEDFWSNSDQASKCFYPDAHMSSYFGKKLSDNLIIAQRCNNHAAAIINVEEDRYETFYPSLSQEDYRRLTDGEDGFEMWQKDHGFFRRESRFFSFKGFMDDLVNHRLEGVKERRNFALDAMAANLDGTCGEKVHEFMMGILQE